MKESYRNIINYSISEMNAAEDQVASISESMRQIRDLSINSTNVAYDGNVATLGTYIKGILNDLVRNSNADFNGKYLFSGTSTTPDNIKASFPDMNNMPYEIVEGNSTDENPSGLKVVFKGNMDNRVINKDAHSQEIININPNSLFGEGGVKYFQPIIEMYNVLQFNSDGSKRETLDSLSNEDKSKINEFQKQIANNLEVVNKNTALFAAKRNRMDSVGTQMSEEIVRLEEVKSLKEDADMPRILTELAKEENALQYSLSTGSKIQKYSLFDFI
ncbi:hypothetical protein SDC9_160501 [bioreactor metagenome]|uniref:Flagellin C-terminal domain-containing protein n=1 Tax=bioreactor metagenome TaxID=1076179 RepID=A0A645FFN8_9ZZZZ